MAMNRDKFRNIVGGITTPEIPPASSPSEPDESPAPVASVTPPVVSPPAAGQGGKTNDSSFPADQVVTADNRRFAKRGRPKGRKDDGVTDKIHKIKVSLYIDESITNDLYDWAHQDKMHPGEMFDRALRFFHKHEKKRRNAEKE